MANKLTKEKPTKERNRKRKPTNRTTEDEAARGHLFSCIQDFTNAAIVVEDMIKDYDLRDDSRDAVPEMNGRIHQDMWESMKNVSHFNLGIALELMIKYLLSRNGKGKRRGHKLTTLHDKLPEQIAQRLESTFQDIKRKLPGGCELIALLTKPPPKPSPEKPSALHRKLSSLRDFFEYFDQDVKLAMMRYSYELVEQRRWRHYLSDLTLFTTFIDHVLGNIERYIVPESGREHGGTGERVCLKRERKPARGQRALAV